MLLASACAGYLLLVGVLVDGMQQPAGNKPPHVGEGPPVPAERGPQPSATATATATTGAGGGGAEARADARAGG